MNAFPNFSDSEEELTDPEIDLDILRTKFLAKPSFVSATSALSSAITLNQADPISQLVDRYIAEQCAAREKAAAAAAAAKKNPKGKGKAPVIQQSIKTSLPTSREAWKDMSSNKHHSTALPGKRIPVNLRPRVDEHGNPSQADPGRGLTTVTKTAAVPTMAAECPNLTRTSVTVETDPVTKVSWGPYTRVEASPKARDAVKGFYDAVQALKKGLGEGKKNSMIYEESSDDSGGETAEELTPGKSKGKQCAASVGAEYNGEETVKEVAEASTRAEAASTTDSKNDTGVAGLRGAPPSTPPEATMKASAAAAMSMPTLPLMIHPIADAKLTERFRVEYNNNPEAFMKETTEIKNGLLEAKVKRGGIAVLLIEE
jgi:hypothetical protein